MGRGGCGTSLLRRNANGEGCTPSVASKWVWVGVEWRRDVSPCPAVKMSVNVVGRGVSLCRIQVLILKSIPFWGNEHDSLFPYPHSAGALILVNFEVGVGKESLNWPKRPLTHSIWPISRWWGIEKLELTKMRTCVLNLANSR